MTVYSLDDFFAVYHGCNDQTLQKAVMHCAASRHREALRRTGYPWRPRTRFHRTLRQIMIMESPPRLAPGQVTRDVVRVCRVLVTHCLGPLPKPAPPLLNHTLWGLFNATNLYTREEIRSGIWHAMYGIHGDDDAWKPDLLNEARSRATTAANNWERELIKFITYEAQAGCRPETPRNVEIYDFTRKTRACLRRISRMSHLNDHPDRPLPPPIRPGDFKSTAIGRVPS